MAILACGPSLPTPAQEAAVDADRAAQVECVVRYATRVDIDACRDRVKAARDGGAP